MKYRKKPVEIEALQWDGTKKGALPLLAWINGTGHYAYLSGIGQLYMYIETLEGQMRAAPGDWIIQGVRGEFYPCKPDIFEQTYEEVAEDATMESKSNS